MRIEIEFFLNSFFLILPNTEKYRKLSLYKIFHQNKESVFLLAAEHLGFNNSIPPFATARGQEILKGVNYASGAAGIREETGQQQVISQ